MPAARNVSYLLIVLILTLAGLSLHGQDRCGSDRYLKSFQRDLSKERFEEWVRSHQRIRALETGRKQASVYKIPVVVHVIHNGENHETNIPDAQIFSQLRVLNEDYKRKNADAINTPAVFASLAGELDIEFVLAKQTPEGLPTNGIVRKRGSKDNWTIDDQYLLKGESYWPAADYLNIWVCNETDYLGYAQFPQTSLVPGLETASANEFTDGVVITYSAFGSIDDGNFVLQNLYNKGRTATHEIGHYFGLRHIWGDDGTSCGNSGDYVDDTPDQAGRTIGCPSHPRTSCNSASMFQNYLDYTNDACMNIFTKGQVSRMKIILDNSPRRKSLSTSPGLQAPVPVSNDLGIKEIITPGSSACSGSSVPQIEVRNYGDNTITSFRISLHKNDAFVEEKTFNITLAPLDAVIVSFSPANLVAGSTTLRYTITSTNGGADGKTGDNIKSRETLVPNTGSAPFYVPFTNSLPSDWNIINGDKARTWEYSLAPSSTENNGAMKMDFYDYEDSEGELDLFISPIFDLASAPLGLLLFDVAHAQYPDITDGLRVAVMKNCNTDLNDAKIIYMKEGSALSTAPARENPFTPATKREWRTETVDMNNYLSQGPIQIAFIGVNNWGNNLYVDNIRMITSIFKNATLLDIVSPPPVTCTNTVTPVLRIRNSGTALNSLEIRYTVNGVSAVAELNAGDFTSGTEVMLPLPSSITLNPGANTIIAEISKIDGVDDVDESDNIVTRTVVYNNTTSPVPFRETFEDDVLRWVSVNPGGGASWARNPLSDGNSVRYSGFTNTTIGDEAWLVSPSFDLSNATEASLRFYTSYRVSDTGSEVLELRASEGCAEPFSLVLGSWEDEALDENWSEEEWTPASADDFFEKVINLSALAGKPSVRIALVVTNNNRNNLYVDDIEFFLTDFPTDIDVKGAFTVYPNPARASDQISLLFNLEETVPARIEIIDGLGKTITSFSVENVLNQEWPLDFTNNTPGVYIIRVITQAKTYASKLVYLR